MRFDVGFADVRLCTDDTDQGTLLLLIYLAIHNPHAVIVDRNAGRDRASKAASEAQASSASCVSNDDLERAG